MAAARIAAAKVETTGAARPIASWRMSLRATSDEIVLPSLCIVEPGMRPHAPSRICLPSAFDQPCGCVAAIGSGRMPTFAEMGRFQQAWVRRKIAGNVTCTALLEVFSRIQPDGACGKPKGTFLLRCQVAGCPYSYFLSWGQECKKPPRGPGNYHGAPFG